MTIPAPEIETMDTNLEVQWTAYPNPATNEVIIEYQLPDSAKNPVLLISDVNGNRILQKELDLEMNQFVWNSTDAKTGVYYYTLSFDEQIQQTKQLLLMK